MERLFVGRFNAPMHEMRDERFQIKVVEGVLYIVGATRGVITFAEHQWTWVTQDELWARNLSNGAR